MAIWGALLSLAGTGLSAGLSAVNNKRAKQEQEDVFARQQAHLAAKGAEDPLARSEVQRALGQYDRDAQRQIENARNVSKITGATPEYSLAVQKNLTEGKADLMGNIAAGASERKDKYDALLEQSRLAQAAAQQEYRAQRNEQFANLAGNALSTFGSLVDGAIDSGGNKPSAPMRKTTANGQNEQNEEKKAQALGVVTKRREV